MYCFTPNDGKILKAYADHFSNVWVVLSSFLRPRALPLERFRPENYPTKSEMLSDCEPVTWSEVLRRTGFETLGQIDVALRSSDGGLKPRNQHFEEALERAMSKLELIPPDTGYLAPHNERSLLLRLKELGHSHLLVYDEFGEKVSRKAIDGLLAADIIVSAHAVISTEDGSILIGSHWDSCCSFLCSNAELDQFIGLEKFKCTERTEVYWGLYPI